MFNVSGLSSMRRRCGVALPLSVLLSVTGIGVARAAQPETVTNPVTIANPATSVTVKNPDPSRHAFGATFSQGSSTGAINAGFGTVPAGKRLVIENESLACYLTPSATILYAYINTNLGRTYLLLQRMGTGNGYEYYAGTYTSKMYADPNGLGTGDINFALQASPTYSGPTIVHCDGAIIGHTVAATRP
jgi:hypothetical protein